MNIILFDYYFKRVTDLGLRVYEEKILPESVTLMNEMIYENCTALSEFYSVKRLYCVSFSSIFSPTSNEHTLFQVSNSQFQSR